jgi:hypothetical protein
MRGEHIFCPSFTPPTTKIYFEAGAGKGVALSSSSFAFSLATLSWIDLRCESSLNDISPILVSKNF